MFNKPKIDKEPGLTGNNTNYVLKDKPESAADVAKVEKIRAYRKEASRKASVANKRIKRLEKNNLTETPAYQQYLKNGAAKFSVKGKTYNEVQKEVSKLNKFINSQTSTIRGSNKALKEIASNTGIKYKTMKELRAKSSKFFELSSKVEQYLRTVDDMASAIGYQKIWEAINVYTKEKSIDLGNTTASVDSMVDAIRGAIKEYETKSNYKGESWFTRLI